LTTFVDMAKSHNIPIIGEPPQKTSEGLPGPGGKWDYEVIRRLYDIEKYFDPTPESDFRKKHSDHGSEVDFYC